MVKGIYKKGLVVGIIILFIGASITTSQTFILDATSGEILKIQMTGSNTNVRILTSGVTTTPVSATLTITRLS